MDATEIQTVVVASAALVLPFLLLVPPTDALKEFANRFGVLRIPLALLSAVAGIFTIVVYFADRA